MAHIEPSETVKEIRKRRDLREAIVTLIIVAACVLMYKGCG